MSSGEKSWIALKLTELWELLEVEPEWSEAADGAADSVEPEYIPIPYDEINYQNSQLMLI